MTTPVYHLPRLRSGRGWAYTGALLGGLVSVAANWAHSFIPPAGAPADWTPHPGAVVGAIVWPVFLFIAVEILARVPWPAGLRWAAMRYGGMIPVAAVAAFVSYRHLSGLLAFYGEEPVVYRLGPLAVDGLMVMATGAILATSAHRRPPILSTATVSVAPVVTPPQAPPAPQPATPVQVSASVSTVQQAAVNVRPAPAPTRPPLISAVAFPEQAATPASPAQPVPTAPALAPAPSTPDLPVARVHGAPARLPAPAAMLSRARHLAEAHHATEGQPITPGELAVRMRVDTNTATQLLAVLNLPGTTPARATVNGHPVGAHR